MYVGFYRGMSKISKGGSYIKEELNSSVQLVIENYPVHPTHLGYVSPLPCLTFLTIEGYKVILNLNFSSPFEFYKNIWSKSTDPVIPSQQTFVLVNTYWRRFEEVLKTSSV